MVGLIEVVQNSETVARIQKELGVILGAFKSVGIHTWLTERQPEQDRCVKIFQLEVLQFFL